jgi:hypothetical protein
LGRERRVVRNYDDVRNAPALVLLGEKQRAVEFLQWLGEKTGKIAAATITQYDPDDSWEPVEE